jgi:hypothetical protein
MEWRFAFMLYALSFLISAIAFSLLARGETEPWARDEVRDEKGDVDADKELMEMTNNDHQPKV